MNEPNTETPQQRMNRQIYELRNPLTVEEYRAWLIEQAKKMRTEEHLVPFELVIKEGGKDPGDVFHNRAIDQVLSLLEQEGVK